MTPNNSTVRNFVLKAAQKLLGRQSVARLGIRLRLLAAAFSSDLSLAGGDMATKARRAKITNALFQAHDGSVVSGPFAGMKLLPEASHGDGVLSAKLLGCYEAELHPSIAKAVFRNPELVVNIGCAEGYYAVGIARLLPQARVFGFDIDPKGQDICNRTAVANDVADRLVVAGKCEIELLRPLTENTRLSLLFVDCEGDEVALLDQVHLPGLLHCDMIIECHDFLNPQTTKILKRRFSGSHDIDDVFEGSRDPNQFVSLRDLDSFDRWLAISERRPMTMNWLVCWARSAIP
jgi:protein-L-isoaspartate O-methyltransferase